MMEVWSHGLDVTASDLAYTVGTERIEVTLAGERGQFVGRVMNIYRREAGGWKMVHHHIDFSPQVQDIVSRLQPASG